MTRENVEFSTILDFRGRDDFIQKRLQHEFAEIGRRQIAARVVTPL